MLSSLINKPDDAKSAKIGLTTDPSSCPEAKAPASSSTAVIIRQSSEQTKIEETVIDSLFPKPLLSIMTDYLDESHPYQERYLCTGLFIANLLRIYERAIVHNLLWHIDIDENLEKAKIYQSCLTKVFNIKDPYDLEIEATLLQIMKAAGDRDTREPQEGEQHFGIFERLVELFKALGMQDECKRQDEAWPLDEKASRETMKPYIEAMETFCQQVIKNKDKKIPDAEEELDEAAYEKLLEELSIAKDFEEAFKKPRPGYVVRSGFLSIIGLYLKFLEIRKEHLSELGEYSRKDDVFSGKFYLVYQSLLQRCDLEILNKGLHGVTTTGDIAPHINFAGDGARHGRRFIGLGRSFFFGLFGDKYPPIPLAPCGENAGDGTAGRIYKTYIKQKHRLLIYAAPGSSPADRASDKVMLESISAANTASR